MPDQSDHATLLELETAYSSQPPSPLDVGTLEMIVVRPEAGTRLTPEGGQLDRSEGLVGDRWSSGQRNPANQVTLISVKAVDLVARDRSRWALAGDNLVIDFDVSIANLQVGQQVKVGEAVLEISAQPHTGCQKFASRFGADALRFVNANEGTERRLRGVNARVVRSGAVKIGDPVVKA